MPSRDPTVAPRRGGEGNWHRASIFSAAADSCSIDDPTLFFCVSAQSVSICSLEWGPNSPLKQNMAIGAGVGRASRNNGHKSIRCQIEQDSPPGGPRRKIPRIALSIISILPGSTFSVCIRIPADTTPVQYHSPLPHPDMVLQRPTRQPGQAINLLQWAPGTPDEWDPPPSPDRRRPSRRSLDALLACLGI